MYVLIYIKLDPCKIARFIYDLLKNAVRKYYEKMKALSRSELSKVTRQLRKMGTETSNRIFKNAGVQSISKYIRCKVLRGHANHLKPEFDLR